MIIDAKVESEPRAWLISKINRISPNGICRVTLTQDTFDQHKDYIERDAFGNIIGQWAGYYSSTIEPTPVDYDEPPSIQTIVVTCSGKPQIKVGGSTKTITATFYNGNGEVSEYESGTWGFSIDGDNVSSLLTVTSVSDGKIRVKFNGGDEYINKILRVSFVSGQITSYVDIEILPL